MTLQPRAQDLLEIIQVGEWRTYRDLASALADRPLWLLQRGPEMLPAA